MKRVLLALTVTAWSLLVAIPSSQAGSHCGGTDGPTQIIVTCNDTSEGDTDPGTQPVSTNGLESYEYLWLPACPTALPTVAGAADIACGARDTCTTTSEQRMALWVRQVRDAQGRPVNEGWRQVETACRNPADAGQIRRQLTWGDVLAAIRRLGLPAAEVQSPAYTLVHLETTFWTQPETIDKTLELIGYSVDVHVEPASYTWHWGDGSTQSTTTPGSPYPAKDITHTYAHATKDGPSLALSVDVTYTARYRVDGGDWITIPESVTIAGPSQALPIKEASAVLIAS